MRGFHAIQTEQSSRSQWSDWRAGDQTLLGPNPEVKWLVAHPKLREGRKGEGRIWKYRVATLLSANANRRERPLGAGCCEKERARRAVCWFKG